VLAVDLPDAPVDVQVEVGPQRGTLLVTWMPALRHKKAAAMAAAAATLPAPKITDVVDRIAITGYTVYVDGTKVKQLNSPSGNSLESCRTFYFE
jgi:RIMS-binding protein 2